MVVAMIAVRMMQVVIHDIIRVIAMGNGLVPTAWTMVMISIVALAFMP
jgi:hypothetical protein